VTGRPCATEGCRDTIPFSRLITKKYCDDCAAERKSSPPRTPRPRTTDDPVPRLDTSWMVVAECRGMDPDFFHPPKEDVMAMRAAKKICAVCPVKDECLDYVFSLGAHGRQGVWGGTSERERRRMRRKKAVA
jgi:WhiB family transcriptional regulator, redox-sensing transcriptional regulator